MNLHGAPRLFADAAAKFVQSAEFRRLSLWSLRFAGRHVPGAVALNGRPFRFPDAPSFLAAYEEIFVEGVYAFEPSSAAPYIVDLGANVGLSVLYFKLRHPGAHVLALEPDPVIFDFLQENLAGLEGVELRRAAVWTSATELSFAPDGADGGKLEPGGAVRVQAESILDLLEGKTIDFLKLDIEGAENTVLPACAGKLGAVRNVFVEYHSSTQEPQRLDAIVSTLTLAGFRLSIATVKRAARPYAAPEGGGFDLQLNIFGART